MDLTALVAAATLADIERARAATALIARRGFQRGKDLGADLERFLADRT